MRKKTQKTYTQFIRKKSIYYYYYYDSNYYYHYYKKGNLLIKLRIIMDYID